MAVNHLTNGSILEFKVPMNLGYAYCKILDFRFIREADGILAKVFDCTVQEPLKDISLLNNRDYLFGARRLHDLPNVRGKGAWKFKGIMIGKDDNIIPDFKWSNESAPWIEDLSTIKKWYVIKNLTDIDYNKPCSFDSVKHLENTVISSQNGISIRTAMEVLRKNQKDIKTYFDLNEPSNAAIYNMMRNVPVYATIPIEIRGKGKC
jgi:hypothetical protein